MLDFLAVSSLLLDLGGLESEEVALPGAGGCQGRSLERWGMGSWAGVRRGQTLTEFSTPSRGDGVGCCSENDRDSFIRRKSVVFFVTVFLIIENNIRTCGFQKLQTRVR